MDNLSSGVFVLHLSSNHIKQAIYHRDDVSSTYSDSTSLQVIVLSGSWPDNSPLLGGDTQHKVRTVTLLWLVLINKHNDTLTVMSSSKDTWRVCIFASVHKSKGWEPLQEAHQIFKSQEVEMVIVVRSTINMMDINIPDETSCIECLKQTTMFM